MLSFIFSEALVDLRRAGRVGVSAVLLITLSLTALGGFWLLSLNLGRAVAQWRDRVRVVVFLKDEPTPSALPDLTRRVEALDGVHRVRYVSKAEALSSLRQSLGAQAGVVDHLPRNPLPASLEVTPAEGATTPEATRALAAKLAAFPETEEVQGGAEWVEGLARWQRLFQVVGTPAELIQFKYALFDEGSGREFQSEPILNIAGLGSAAGERPFRHFAQPITFRPRSTVRMEVTEVSDFKGELHVSLQGYKVLGEPNAPTGMVQRRPGRRR